jgi:ankyrin repeat protein
MILFFIVLLTFSLSNSQSSSSSFSLGTSPQYLQDQLFLAVEQNNLLSIITLLKNDVSPNIESAAGWSPLLHAVNKGFYDASRVLLDGGASNRYFVPFIFA